MKSQSLLDKRGWGERPGNKPYPGWNAFVPKKLRPRRYADGSDANDAKWQRHIVVLLWLAIALLIALGSALMYAKGHGFFDSVPHRRTPLPPPWPEGP